MDKDFHKEFKQCPCCGSVDRFFEQLGNELKERGLAREQWAFHLDVRNGPVIDQQRAASIPIGSEIPGYGIMTDVCMECGCIYAIDLVRMDAKLSLAPPQLAKPSTMPMNRAVRRRLERGAGGLGNNPASS